MFIRNGRVKCGMSFYALMCVFQVCFELLKFGLAKLLDANAYSGPVQFHNYWGGQYKYGGGGKTQNVPNLLQFGLIYGKIGKIPEILGGQLPPLSPSPTGLVTIGVRESANKLKWDQRVLSWFYLAYRLYLAYCLKSLSDSIDLSGIKSRYPELMKKRNEGGGSTFEVCHFILSRRIINKIQFATQFGITFTYLPRLLIDVEKVWDWPAPIWWDFQMIEKWL